MRSVQSEQFIFNAQGGTVAVTGTAQEVQDYTHLMLTLSSSSHAAFTINIQGSHADTCPDFSAAQSNTNRWDYVQIKDLQSNTATNGDTGISYTDDDVTQYEINENGLRWVCATITSITQGKVSLRLKTFSNE